MKPYEEYDFFYIFNAYYRGEDNTRTWLNSLFVIAYIVTFISIFSFAACSRTGMWLFCCFPHQFDQQPLQHYRSIKVLGNLLFLFCAPLPWAIVVCIHCLFPVLFWYYFVTLGFVAMGVMCLLMGCVTVITVWGLVFTIFQCTRGCFTICKELVLPV